MPLQKILFKPGVNRENTRYTTEGGWYECDKIRFRQGTPESLGGWAPVSLNTFTGLCRSLWNWVTLAGRNLMGVEHPSGSTWRTAARTMTSPRYGQQPR
jgi:hypothetical protein